MAVLITYEVSSRDDEVRTSLVAKGYFTQLIQNNIGLWLPCGVLWRPEGSPADALEDIRAVAYQLRVNIIRCLAVDFSSSHGIPGESY